MENDQNNRLHSFLIFLLKVFIGFFERRTQEQSLSALTLKNRKIAIQK